MGKDFSAWLGLSGKKSAAVDADEIQPGELMGSGTEIKKGDSRLKGGISRSNLSNDERARLDAYRKKQSGS